MKSFRTVGIIFWAFQDFLIYLAKRFWSLLSSPNYSRVSNRKGGPNKGGGWQISAKIINGQVGKNTAIKNFIEIKSSILRKYQRKEYKKYKGSLSIWRITCSFARISSSRYVRAIYLAAFLTNQKENVLQYLTEKVLVSMEKLMLPGKTLNIIVFCKAQHNAKHMLKKSPNLSLYMLINVMLIKKYVLQTVLWLCLGFTLPLSTVHMN